jgi:hypothetical protein
MTEMDIETSVYYVHLTRLIAREDFIKFTRRESTKTYIDSEGSMLVSAHASTTYGMWRIKSKTQAIATDNTYCVLAQPNPTQPITT